MKTTKLDRRYNGSGRFSHYVEPDGILPPIDRIQQFIEWRNWCWETFGPSAERDFTGQWYQLDVKWAWDTEQYSSRHLRLYFTEETLVVFKLKWS
jgi:hypothetical protein